MMTKTTTAPQSFQSVDNILTNVWAIKNRLLTKDDPFHFHASLGTLCLLSFVWRFAQYGATDMGFLAHSKLTALTIALHFLLSISSLVFHVPKARIKKTGHKMMWAEYRLHAIVFGGRSLACMAWNYYEEVTKSQQPNYLVNLVIVVGTLLAADISSHQAGGTKHSIRGLTDIPSWLKFYYSLLQFFATSYCLFGLRRYSGHMIMIFVVQMTAFLFTLKRKNLAPHDFTLRVIYTSFLYFGSRLGRRELSPQYSGSFIAPYIVTLMACCACVLRIASPTWSPTKNKYLIWMGLGTALHYIRIVNPDIYATLEEDHPQTVRLAAKMIFFLTVGFGLVKDHLSCRILWNRDMKDSNPLESATTNAKTATSNNGPDQKSIGENNSQRESTVDREYLPKHVAIIMDGNRRYGRANYSTSGEQAPEEAAYEGHKDGVKTLFNVVKWCHEEGIQVLTVYGFSTENWSRSSGEVSSLMTLFEKSAQKYKAAFVENNIRVHLVSTDTGASTRKLPVHVRAALEGLQAATAHCTGGLQVNLCISYSGREEIVGACRKIAQQVASGEISDVDSINEGTVQQAFLRPECPDPDVLIRTSGDYRLSNFLLWQLAYTELFFLKDIHWPEFQKRHLLKVIREYAECRQRRFGK